MLYNPDGDQLEPEKGSNEPKKLIDLSVMRKGANYTSKAQKDEQIKEEAYLRAEEDRLGKAEKEAERLRKIEEAKRKDEKEMQLEKQKEQMKGGAKAKEPEPEGKLRMGQV